MSSTALVWFRRDLRLADNLALERARNAHQQIVPVFVWDPDAEGAWAPGAASRWWLHHALVELDARLRQRGSRLIIAQGDTNAELERIVRACSAEAVYWNRLYEPAFVERDKALKAALRGQGLEAVSCGGALLFEPWQLLKSDQTPYLVFTPFWKQMQKRWATPQAAPEPRRLEAPARWPASMPLADLGLLPERNWADGFSQRWEPGELAARRRLNQFVERSVSAYEQGRDRPGDHGTSRLSPHLHFGELSPAQVALALDASGAMPTGKGCWSFLREIAWREFSAHLLFHHPSLPDRALKRPFDHFPWREPAAYAEDLRAWQQGRTGIPMVDAGMRELWTTGWMHNRVRMIVASFLTKNLLIPWQEGAKWFWDTLVDADLANNTAGWQWTAGCGADAAPYFRVFNPVLQGQKFDPDGAYVGRWCPELRDRERKQLHEPVATAAIVDLKASRRRALSAYEAIKSQ